MNTKNNRTSLETDARGGSRDSIGESNTTGTESNRAGRYRRKFLQGVGTVGILSLAGCTVDENGIRWGDEDQETPDESETDTPDEASTDTPESGATDASGGETTEEPEELDLSQYEDGCFSGGTPRVSEGTRDGVEITVTAGEVESRIEQFRETYQYDFNEDLQLRDNIDLALPDEEEDEELVLEAEVIEGDDEENVTEVELVEVDDNQEVIEAEIIETDDEEDDDEQ